MSGCGCGCKIKLKVDDEFPIGLQIIDGETVRVDCADFLIRTDKDYNHLENKPSINNVELVGNKSLAELGIDIDGKLDKPLDDGINNAILKNVAGEKPKWSSATFTAERNGTASRQGQAIFSAGSRVDENTDGGYVGVYRILRGKGEASSTVMLASPAPTENVSRQYLFGYNTPDERAYVVSSQQADNTVGKLAKFDGGTSVTESDVAEGDIELKTNKVTSLTSESTDAEYPSAKAVYDGLQDKMDAPLGSGELNAILKAGEEAPEWSPAAFVADRDGTASLQGQSILSVGTEVDENTSGGYVGLFRLLRAKGAATSRILLFGATPTLSVTRQYRFGYNTPNTLANVLSSSADNNIVGAIAKFESGTSVIAGVAESALELNTNKVSTISQDSTDDQYPSAKCVYDSIEEVTPETLTDEEIDAICI